MNVFCYPSALLLLSFCCVAHLYVYANAQQSSLSTRVRRNGSYIEIQQHGQQ